MNYLTVCAIWILFFTVFIIYWRYNCEMQYHFTSYESHFNTHKDNFSFILKLVIMRTAYALQMILNRCSFVSSIALRRVASFQLAIVTASTISRTEKARITIWHTKCDMTYNSSWHYYVTMLTLLGEAACPCSRH